MASLKHNKEAARKRDLMAKKALEGRDQEFRPKMPPNKRKRLTVTNLEDFMEEINDG